MFGAGSKVRLRAMLFLSIPGIPGVPMGTNYWVSMFLFDKELFPSILEVVAHHK